MIVNPFDVDIPEAWKNEIIYQKYIAFLALRQTTNTLNNIQNNNLNQDDFIYRDILFKNQMPQEQCDTYFDYMKQHYKSRKQLNSSDFLKQRREECQNKKFNFWQKCTKLPINTKQKLETRNIVRDIKYQHLILPQILFLSGSIIIAYLLKMYRNPIKFQLITIGFGSSLGYFHGVYNYSNQIFNDIPYLPDPELEVEHQHIMNYCFSLDQDLIARYVFSHQNLHK
ncbi:unnamed protein product [Paramecium sonneborni]|uniref:Transmembrane protein n=1 Tax=Paramecium sonneborni TaxID=65129 RepID=A0A8S1NU86_9CILI|nr:unnamed protein product [Paramecium sonneborni]